MLLNVDSDSNGQRLDNFLVKMVKISRNPHLSNGKNRRVRINSKRVRAFTKVYQGDLVRSSLSGMTIGIQMRI